MTQSLRAENKVVKVLLVEEHGRDCQGLQLFLEEYPRVQIVGTARTSYEAVATAVQLHPEIILMDFQFQQGQGVAVCQEILSRSQGTKVIFLTDCEDGESAIEAMKVGASGYLAKSIKAPCLIQAIELTISSQLFINSGVLRSIQFLLKGRGKDWSNGHLSMEQRRILGLVNQRSRREYMRS